MYRSTYCVLTLLVLSAASTEISPFQHEHGVDLYLMFGTPTTLGGHTFNRIKKFAKELVKEIGVTDDPNSLRVGAMYFGSSPNIAFPTILFHNTRDVVRAIHDIPYEGGSTNIAEAFHFVHTMMIPYSDHRDGSRRIAVIITDGESDEGGDPELAARALEAEGVEIYCVGVSESASKDGLRAIASFPKEDHIFSVKNYHSVGALVDAVTNQTTDYSECGVSKYMAQVLSGSDETPAREGAWPWQVYFEIHVFDLPEHFVCGGTLVRNDTILTSASCVPVMGTMRAFAGVTDRLKKDIGQMRVIREADINIHEDYNSYTYSHDIALIHVDPPFRLTPNVRPACLPNPAKEDRLLHRGAAIVTGWGHEGPVPVNAGNDFPYEAVRDLQQLTLPLKSRRDCTNSLVGDEEANWFDDTMTCAGYNNKELGACRGDSGGPLIKYASYMNRRRWTVIGISSWGIGCAARGELDFFTNVPHFVDWIKEKMDPSPPATPSA